MNDLRFGRYRGHWYRIERYLGENVARAQTSTGRTVLLIYREGTAPAVPPPVPVHPDVVDCDVDAETGRLFLAVTLRAREATDLAEEHQRLAAQRAYAPAVRADQRHRGPAALVPWALCLGCAALAAGLVTFFV